MSKTNLGVLHPQGMIFEVIVNNGHQSIFFKITNIRKRKLENIKNELVIGDIKDKLQLRLDKTSNFGLERDTRCDDY